MSNNEKNFIEMVTLLLHLIFVLLNQYSGDNVTAFLADEECLKLFVQFCWQFMVFRERFNWKQPLQ